MEYDIIPPLAYLLYRRPAAALRLVLRIQSRSESFKLRTLPAKTPT